MHKLTINLTQEKLYSGLDNSFVSTLWMNDTAIDEVLKDRNIDDDKYIIDYALYQTKIAELYCKVFEEEFNTKPWRVVSHGFLNTSLIIELEEPTVDNMYRIKKFLDSLITYPKKCFEFELYTVYENYDGFELLNDVINPDISYEKIALFNEYFRVEKFLKILERYDTNIDSLLDDKPYELANLKLTNETNSEDFIKEEIANELIYYIIDKDTDEMVMQVKNGFDVYKFIIEDMKSYIEEFEVE